MKRDNPIASLPGARRIKKKFADNLMRDMTEKAVPAVLQAVRDQQRINREGK